jgi:hypothetical protein
MSANRRFRSAMRAYAFFGRSARLA